MRTTARATRSTRIADTARSSRSTRKNTAVAVAVLAALSLSLTACSGDGGSDDGKAAGAGQGAAGTDASGGEGSAGGSSSGEETASTPGDAAPAPRAAGDGCTLATTKITLEDTGGSAPFVLLKITNNGGKACSVLGAPVVSDPTTGEDFPTAENTRPQSVVRVGPARSAYAAINLAGMDAVKTHRAKTLGITLAAKNAKDAKDGQNGQVTVKSPGAAGLLLNADSHVTYWQNTLEDAMS
ncbi:DUF4232 domain-containing protein [Streptomyces sp. NBC_01283]|uniref:DUF4232 domain-containing protein n=1 Tax=Streptomyces sp. NBC_01283 TaxID=2903812 RepID=UPI00352EDB26|nr:DUF4232 domain-containing protein [Streptomyces sp. NBC_01283]